MEGSLARALFATSPNAVMVVGLDGVVAAANPAADALFGSNPDQRRKAVATILPSLGQVSPLDFGLEDSPCSKATRRLTTCNADGERLDLDLRCVPFENDGAPYVAIFIYDITAPASAERSLQALRTQIATNWRLNSLGELAALVAHELNQPLAAIANYLHIAANHSAGREDIREPIMQATAQTHRATETIRRFRSLTARHAVSFEPVDARELVSEILPLLTLVTREADAELKLDIGKTRAFVCDRIQIQQVLLNLVRNAAEASRGVAGALVSIRCEERDESVSWSVSDNGCGVPEDTRPELFKPTVSTKADGMGLGLSICRSIVEAHGGRIALEATSDGATFTFWLPLDPPA